MEFLFILLYFGSIMKSRSNTFLERNSRNQWGKVSCSRKQREPLKGFELTIEATQQLMLACGKLA